MELTPRTLDDDSPRHRHRRPRRWLSLAVVVTTLVAVGVLVTKGLTDATVYFRNADEAIAQRDDLGTRRFRLQGTVVADPDRTGDHIAFDVAYNDVTVAVRHTGDPPELFRPGVPVVLEGHWAADTDVFESDRILVKHDETYESRGDYEDRMRRTERRQRPAAQD